MSEPKAMSIDGPISADRASLEIAPLDTFVRQHYARLVRLAGLITRDVDQAQDAVQAALERAWQKRAAMRDPASLRAWLDQIVVREAIRQTRGRGLVQVERDDRLAALHILSAQQNASTPVPRKGCRRLLAVVGCFAQR